MTLITHIHQIAVYSSDLVRSIEFYKDKLGAKFLAKFDPPGLAFFQFGQTRLLLEKNGKPSTLYFFVADIHLAVAELKSKGIHFVQGPTLVHVDKEGIFGKPNSEEWMAFFKDPDENILAFASINERVAL